MSAETAMPANGHGQRSGEPDGVNTPEQRGRAEGGESGGGGSAPEASSSGDGGQGFMGHGGQSDIAYHGGGQAGDEGTRAGNGVTGDGRDLSGGGEKDGVSAPSAPYQDRVAEQTREEHLDGRTVEVFEESGVAAAEASGMTGVAGERKIDGEQPGAG